MRLRATIAAGVFISLALGLTAATAHAQGVESVAFSPDGKTFAVGYTRGTLELYDFATRKLIREYEGHTKEVRSIAFSPDGRLMASGAETVRLWNIETGEMLAALEGHKEGFGVWGWLRSVAFSPDGRLLASGGADGTIKLWDVGARKLLRTLMEPSDYPVITVAFSPDGKLLASGGADAKLKLWEAATGKMLRELTDGDDFGAQPRTVIFSPDGKTLISGNGNAKIILWEPATGKRLRTLEARGVHHLALSPDGKLLASVHSPDVTVWDLGLGAKIKSLPAQGRVVAFSRDGKTLLAGTSDGELNFSGVEPD